ncbi:MAG: hypothetical protein KGY68_05575 [Candidatus Thermoplasmatota archaeon]|nr:hypothetical protein [Candidatus Thermoplasmatota archaeon]
MESVFVKKEEKKREEVNGKIFRLIQRSSEMEAGDTLWHPSDIPHHAENADDEKASYVT